MSELTIIRPKIFRQCKSCEAVSSTLFEAATSLDWQGRVKFECHEIDSNTVDIDLSGSNKQKASVLIYSGPIKCPGLAAKKKAE